MGFFFFLKIFFQNCFSKSAVMKLQGQLKEFMVTGRKLPTDDVKNPPMHQMRIFAPNVIVAKSRFWYFLSNLRKIKKSKGEIVQINRIMEKDPTTVKNVGIWLRYDSRSSTHNMYREYRDLTIPSAATQCYRDMGARHRARAHSIQIMRVEVIPDDKCRRPNTTQWHLSAEDKKAGKKMCFPKLYKRKIDTTNKRITSVVPRLREF